MKKKVICLFILFILPIYTGFSDTIGEIDRTVNRISAYITTTIQDKEGISISIEPLLSDSKKNGEPGILGQRISSLLELSLASIYKHAKITHSLDGSSMFTVSGEIQPYEKKVRVIIRIIKSDGSLAGGMHTDIVRTPEINALINANSSMDQGAEQPPPIEDQFEPDDNPGFEVEVQPEGKSTFERNLTFQDIDRFIFQLRDKKSIEISVFADIDIKMLIFQEGDDFPIATNIDPEGTGTSSINTTLNAGIYVIEISGFTPYVTGPYKLEISFSDEPLESGKKIPVIKPGEKLNRSVPANGPDWIKPQSEIPGFYSLVLNSSDTALKVTVYSDKNSQPLFKETGTYPGKPLITGLFLGVIPVKVGVNTASSTGEPVFYTAGLQELRVTKVYPDGTHYRLNNENSPLFILLRIINSGKYTIEFKEPDTDIKVLALPAMVKLKGIYKSNNPLKAIFSLSSGDYLIRAESKNANAVNYISINSE